MLCDWSAMSLKFKSTPSEFYEMNKYKMVFTYETRLYIEQNLSVFDKVVKGINEKV